MSLFTKYTKAETEFLLKVVDMDFSRNNKKNEINIFENIPHKDLKKIITNYTIKEFNKKEIIKTNQIIYIIEGIIGIVKNGKIIQKLHKDEIIGLEKSLLNNSENYSLLAISKIKIALFDINEKETNKSLDILYKNISIYLIKELKKFKIV